MSHKHQPSALEKEFELERVILFSDAVFAIAITLLIIDIKWPDAEHLVGEGKIKALQSMLLSFVAFFASFFFIGRFWALHLQLFRLLRRYNQGLIKRNLFFLFFIVTFPFTAAGVAGHVFRGFLLPLYCYFINLVMVSVMHFVLCAYITRQKPSLAVEGFVAEKKYFYVRSLYTTYALCATLAVLIITDIATSGEIQYVAWTPASVAIFLRLAKRKINKYKPAEVED